MYIPEYFEISKEEIMYDMIEKNSFSTLVSKHEGGLSATHLPLILDRDTRTLYGHFAHSNDQWTDAEDEEILAIFNGPHAYISPSWYETNQAVPTWNYAAVHVYGELTLLTDDQEIFHTLSKMVKQYEIPNSTYQLEDIETSLINGLSKGITAFKITITRMEGKAKLSQNQPIERQQLIIKELEKNRNFEIPQLMKENLKNRA